MIGRLRTGYTFDDVLLVPQRSSVRSRGDVDVTTRLCRDLRLRIPLISANTQWCTGARMAAAMATQGGLGFLHRMQTIDQQLDQLIEVKKTPVPQDAALATLSPDGTLAVGVAVGVTDDHLDRAATLVAAGAGLLLVDVAHGHADHVIDTVRQLRAAHPEIILVAGNVATAAGTRDLAEAGADVVKVGIGPGGVCTTRLVAGSGVPQLTAIADCAATARELGAGLIADGGIRTSGDIAKALAAGADAVMLGSALAGCDESEALPYEKDGRRYKASRGFATLGMANTLRLARGERLTREQVDDYVAEGVEATFPATGPLSHTLKQLTGGLRSGMSYSGARTIEEFRAKAEFIQVTPAGRAENVPHVLASAPAPAPDYRAEAVSHDL